MIPSFSNVFEPDIKKTHTIPVLRFVSKYHRYCNFFNGEEDREFDGNVTILIPCYKKANFIINTVKSCVQQTFQNVKTIILLMDEESQKLSQILESMGNVQCVNSERLIVTKARKKLVDMCSTDWFIFLDADDELDPKFIEILSKKKGAIRFSGCRFYHDSLTKPVLSNLHKDNISNIIAYNNTALMHKDVFYDIGYDDSLAAGGEDTDFLLRLICKRKWLIGYTTDTYYIYNLFTENQLTKNPDFATTHYNAFKKNVDNLLEGLKGCWVRFKDIEKIVWTLNNFTLENICAFVDSEDYPTDFKIRFDRLCSHTYYKYLEKSNENKEPFELHGGRVKTFEDLLYKAQDIKIRSDLPPIQRLFFVLENFKCFESSDVNDREVVYISDDFFFDYVNSYKFPEEIQRFIRIWKLRDTMHAEGKDMQKVSFLFNKTCNENCPYCFQERNAKCYDDDTLYKNFDEALSKFEKLTNNNVFPQILGGEPTLFSDYLITKILNRLHNYKTIYVFTNGKKKDSLWYKQSNVVLNHHLVNWSKGDIPQRKEGEVQSIVVCKNEIPALNIWLESLDGVIINPCNSNKEQYNCTYEDRKTIREITKRTRAEDAALAIFDKSLEENQSRCRASVGVWEYDVGARTVSTCCADLEKIPLENFTGNEKLQYCGNCMNFGNML